MKKEVLRNVAILALFVALAVVSIHAQTPDKGTANIPFDFVAGKAKLKAGSYTLKHRSGNVFAISQDGGKAVALVNAPLTVSSQAVKNQGRLVFNRYGDRYFLSQVWLSANAGRQLLPSEAEMKARQEELANRGTKPQRVEIAARLR